MSATSSTPNYSIEIASQNALIIYFDQQASNEVLATVQLSAHCIKSAMGDVLIDLVPSYASLLVIFDLFKTDHATVQERAALVLAELSVTGSLDLQGKLITLPVYYDIDSGPDLLSLSREVNLSVEQVIELHQLPEYRVYAMGFAPGFAYLGEVDQRIAKARQATPRAKVPRGSVGIADRQTAIYPSESPGGWNLIGRCPVPMFDSSVKPYTPVQVGDRVRFEAISRQQYLKLGGQL